MARTVMLALLMLVVAAGIASACPSCKETVAGDNAGLAAGLSYSVLGMMSMPFLLVALVAGIVVRAYRRTRFACDGNGNGDEPI